MREPEALDLLQVQLFDQVLFREWFHMVGSTVRPNSNNAE